MEIKDFLPLPDMENCKSLLCIQPHPDDNEVGAGATIAKLSARGCKITYLTVTDGSMGTADPSQDPAQLAAIRKNEVKKSAAALGVSDVLHLDFKDGGYADEKLLCQNIVSVIRQVRPEFVMTVDPFLPYEVHPDHRRVGTAASEACLFSQFPGFKAPDGRNEQPEVWAVKGIAYYSTAYPNTFINVDETWENKMYALSQHESQFPPQALQTLGYYFDVKAKLYAKDKPFLRAEAFKVLTTDHLHMNVDTINL